MDITEVSGKRTGVYRIFWEGGGQSVASIYVSREGKKMLAPANWVNPAPLLNEADKIKSMHLISWVPETAE